MPDKSDQHLVDALVQEYKTLKAEQNLRIATRDHLLYANLGVVGAVCYFALSDHGSIHALLVIPWACFILGWTYLCNDEKISNIREYIKKELAPQVSALHAGKSDHHVFGWEMAHRIGENRMRFKITQLAVDIITFVLSGFTALCIYFLSIPNWFWWHYVAFVITLTIMLVLSMEFITHFISDTKDLRSHSKAK